LKRRTAALWALAALASLAAGFALTRGLISWDDLSALQLSRYLLSRFGLHRGPVDVIPWVRWYGPLWEFCLGLAAEFPFAFLKDPIWVRHAVTFACFPMTLLLVPALLMRGGVKPSTALLASSFLFGMIRFGGHAAVNVKDFPFACAYLLATLYLWVLLREGHARSGGRGYTLAELARLGLVALVPYLLRPPALVQFPLLLLFLAFYCAFVEKGAPRWKAAAVPAGLLLLGLAVIALAFPAIREDGWRAWLSSFAGFSRFPWTGDLRVFGRVIPAARLSRSYLFLWIPVILHPLVLVAAGGGLLLTAARAESLGHPFPLKIGRREWNLSLRVWLGAILALTWGLLLARMPVLYDEERHILFLYPPLLVLAALGLDPLRDRSKRVLAALIVGAGLVSYAEWGRYSYVYKSPLVGSAPGRFMGDYWGVCVPLAVRAMDGLVPRGTDVLIDGPEDAAVLESSRLAASTFGLSAGFGPYGFRTDGVFKPPFAAISSNRFGQHLDRVLRDAALGRAKLLWRGDMPPGEPACVLVEYLKPKPAPPAL
jgi:hypothetical protein